MKILERHLKEVQLHQSLDWKNAQLEWKFSEASNVAVLPLWLLSRSTSDLMIRSRCYGYGLAIIRSAAGCFSTPAKTILGAGAI